MLENIFDTLGKRPALYAPSDSPFWDDEYISKQMLAAHLDPDTDAASRKLDFMRESANWIINQLFRGANVLDLGCGPGLYAEMLTWAGLNVTGIDISRRSIEYARTHCGENARFIRGDYLSVDFGAGYDAAMIIYKDYGVLSPENRAKLLKKVFAALKPGGIFIVDACSMKELANYKEGQTAEYCRGGFWRADEYLLVTSNYAYSETANVCDQYAVISREGGVIYNTWNQMYSRASLLAELGGAGFENVEFFADVAGAEYTADSDTICAVSVKSARA